MGVVETPRAWRRREECAKQRSGSRGRVHNSLSHRLHHISVHERWHTLCLDRFNEYRTTHLGAEAGSSDVGQIAPEVVSFPLLFFAVTPRAVYVRTYDDESCSSYPAVTAPSVTGNCEGEGIKSPLSVGSVPHLSTPETGEGRRECPRRAKVLYRRRGPGRRAQNPKSEQHEKNTHPLYAPKKRLSHVKWQEHR